MLSTSLQTVGQIFAKVLVCQIQRLQQSEKIMLTIKFKVCEMVCITGYKEIVEVVHRHGSS